MSSCPSWPRALELLKCLKLSSLQPTVVTYGALAESPWRQALKAFEELLAMRLAPNEVIFNALLSACGAEREWRVALELLRGMKAYDLRPDVGLLVGSGARNKGENRGDELYGGHPGPFSPPKSGSMEACVAWEQALSLFQELQERLTPDLVACSSILTACSGAWEVALGLLSSMPRPDTVCVNAALNACASCKA